jgi:hypothetical protein
MQGGEKGTGKGKGTKDGMGKGTGKANGQVKGKVLLNKPQGKMISLVPLRCSCRKK